MSTRVASWLAWSLFALTLALSLGTVALMVALTRAAAAPGSPVPSEVAAGLRLSGLGWLQTVFYLATACAFAALGAVLVARQSRDPAHALGWLFCALGVVGGMLYFAEYYAAYALFVAPGALPGGLAAGGVQHWIWLVVVMFLVALVPLRFPTGRLVSARWRPAWWLAVGATAAESLLLAFAPIPLGNVLDGADVPNPLGIAGLAAVGPAFIVQALLLVVLLASMLVAVASLVVRLGRARGIERQQLKWFAYSASLLGLLEVAQSVVQDVLGISSPALDLAWTLSFFVAVIGLPVATGLAILRYRLFDIDVLINRTLVYGTLTALLAGVYFGSVIGAQALVRALTGQREQLPVVIVASTLLIAALFNPLRHGIQATIDRRFYRRKYDAAKTLHAFSATLRSEVELAEVSAHLLTVVNETMQPAHASLWLRRPPDREVER